MPDITTIQNTPVTMPNGAHTKHLNRACHGVTNLLTGALSRLLALPMVWLWRVNQRAAMALVAQNHIITIRIEGRQYPYHRLNVATRFSLALLLIWPIPGLLPRRMRSISIPLRAILVQAITRSLQMVAVYSKRNIHATMQKSLVLDGLSGIL